MERHQEYARQQRSASDARPSIIRASRMPAPTPSTIHGAQLFKISKSTAPRRACACTDRSDVKTIVASEVPIATWAYSAWRAAQCTGSSAMKRGHHHKAAADPEQPGGKARPSARRSSNATSPGNQCTISAAVIDATDRCYWKYGARTTTGASNSPPLSGMSTASGSCDADDGSRCRPRLNRMLRCGTLVESIAMVPIWA